MKILPRYITAVFTAFALLYQNADAQPDCLTLKPAIDSINTYLSRKATVNRTVDIDTLLINKRSIEVHLNDAISDYPLRAVDLQFMTDAVRSSLPDYGTGLDIKFLYGGKPVERLISGHYSGMRPDKHINKSTATWIEKIDSPIDITEGLQGRNIALWLYRGIENDPGAKIMAVQA